MPLKVYTDEEYFKLFIVDVGLLGAMLDLSAKTIIPGNELFNLFKGAFTENYAAQELISAGKKDLYFWTSDNTAEVDFIVSTYDQIYP